MRTKYNKISILTYLNLSQLLKEYQGSHEENRVFALKHQSLIKNPKKLILLWTESSMFRVQDTLDSRVFSVYFSSMSTLFSFISLLLGFFTGMGLLNYSGDAPVNVIYYLLFSMGLPLFSMVLTFFSMFSHGIILNFFTLFFPLHWVEKIFSLFSFGKNINAVNDKFTPALKKWMFINRLQLFSLFFSIGLLLAILLEVAIQDIAFSWSTTLEVTPFAFQEFLTFIATPWSWFFPDAIPSVELVHMSHYYRLGERLDPEMIKNANVLGGWWQFLAMVTFFYAIILRVLMLIISHFGFKWQLGKDFLSLNGVDKLLREFQTSYVSTESQKLEKHLEIVSKIDTQIKDNHRRTYKTIIGWNFSNDEIALANDSKEIKALTVQTVGGNHTFLEDQEVAKLSSEVVLLYVKSWEPPTMDFVDFLELLIANIMVNEIQVYPLGTVGRYYESSEKEVAVWKRKIEGLKSKKVWVIDA